MRAPAMMAVESSARRFLARPARFVRRAVLPWIVPPAPARSPPLTRDVRVVGLLSSASGVGKSARLCAEALGGERFSVSYDDVSDVFGSDDGVPFRPQSEARFRPGGVSIYHLNPPMLLPGLLRSGLGRYYRSYNVGYWAWELERLPREWVEGLRYVDAILVPSEFCREAVSRHTPKPVLVVPHPVPDDARPRLFPQPRAERFRVLSIFNFGSSFERKNPAALIQAFRAAFGDDGGAELILKTSQGHRFAAEKVRLVEALRGIPNATLIDEVWDERRLTELLGSSDVYVSLHRSEGYGLTLAEAIVSEVPVIATSWSGNVDFCTPDLCYPVDWELVPFSDPHTDYSQVDGARWAEPSIETAVRHLRRVRSEPDEARDKARRLRSLFVTGLRRRTYAAALANLSEGRLDAAASP